MGPIPVAEKQLKPDEDTKAMLKVWRKEICSLIPVSHLTNYNHDRSWYKFKSLLPEQHYFPFNSTEHQYDNVQEIVASSQCQASKIILPSFHILIF